MAKINLMIYFEPKGYQRISFTILNQVYEKKEEKESWQEIAAKGLEALPDA